MLNANTALKFGIVKVGLVREGTIADGRLGTTSTNQLAFTEAGLDEYVSRVIPELSQFEANPLLVFLSQREGQSTEVTVEKDFDNEVATLRSGEGMETIITNHLMRTGVIRYFGDNEDVENSLWDGESLEPGVEVEDGGTNHI